MLNHRVNVWFFIMENGNFLVRSWKKSYHLKRSETFLGVKYSWSEQITPESGKLLGSDGGVLGKEDGGLLAEGLPMSKTWRLRMEVLFRPDNRVSHRTIFQGTDGGSFSHTRCGGRLPGIWTVNAAPPISSGFYVSALKLLFFLFQKNSKILEPLKILYLQLCKH